MTIRWEPGQIVGAFRVIARSELRGTTCYPWLVECLKCGRRAVRDPYDIRRSRQCVHCPRLRTEKLQKVVDLHTAGVGGTEIARRLGISRARVYQLLVEL
jgi:hypothetical protein